MPRRLWQGADSVRADDSAGCPAARDNPPKPQITRCVRGEGHVEFVRAGGDRAGLQVAALVAADRLHLAGIAGGEDLVGVVELGGASRCAPRR